MGWEQLRRGVALPFDPRITIPELHEVELPAATVEPVADVEEAAKAAVVDRLAAAVTAGTTVAVGAGSRGSTDRVELLRGTIAGLRELGAEPFVVPAMGSHGGATADGQLAVLTELGITVDTIGAEIRSSVDTVVIANDDDGRPLFLDVHAAGADGILPVNRVKPHTSFRGPVESGCAKMAVVGFGKQPGAAQFHAGRPVDMCDRLLTGVRALRAAGRLLGGVASVESSNGAVVDVCALTATDVGGAREADLTGRARALVAALPFEQIDVLVVERGGKDVSGTTMDPNVTGRFWIEGIADLERPQVGSIVLLALTDVTAGNALGIGFADFVPAALAGSVDWQSTYLNCVTAGTAGVRRARLPMVLPDEEACIRAALATCGRAFDEPKRVVRIRSTLHLSRCWVNDTLLGELPAGARRVERAKP